VKREKKYVGFSSSVLGKEKEGPEMITPDRIPKKTEKEESLSFLGRKEKKPSISDASFSAKGGRPAIPPSVGKGRGKGRPMSRGSQRT